ncbi:hypothetical protein L2E82_31151 [Cichorium intybus]|uniref:Uncharacterized protein n=1 Tax=Cichorium intybus TaxID=13427 RepID=A0ACB9D2Q8_CICIN|nr:hypothetical protein L2E82_31151 [Cichorium intybus]
MLAVELAERHIAGIEHQAITGCMIPAWMASGTASPPKGVVHSHRKPWIQIDGLTEMGGLVVAYSWKRQRNQLAGRRRESD